jgi:hypothetical protein
VGKSSNNSEESTITSVSFFSEVDSHAKAIPIRQMKKRIFIDLSIRKR